MAFDQVAIDADDQLFRAVAVVDGDRCLRAEDRAQAGRGTHLLGTTPDQFLAADRHLDQGEGAEYAGLDADIAAIAHPPDADPADAPVIDARVHRAFGVQAAQAVLAEDTLAPLARFVEILRVADLEAGQDGLGWRCRRKSQVFHCAHPLS
ncbi:hypothetical protein D3C80_1438610 [compost metagenome]